MTLDQLADREERRAWRSAGACARPATACRPAASTASAARPASACAWRSPHARAGRAAGGCGSPWCATSPPAARPSAAWTPTTPSSHRARHGRDPDRRARRRGPRGHGQRGRRAPGRHGRRPAGRAARRGSCSWSTARRSPPSARRCATGAARSDHVARGAPPDGGERTIAWTATAVRDDAGRLAHAVCIGLDMTAQRAAEHRARSAHAALELTSRELERAHRELGGFVAAASRDLRDPLRPSRLARRSSTGRRASSTPRRGRAGARRARAAPAGGRARRARRPRAPGAGRGAAGDVDVGPTVDAVLRDLAGDLDARGAEVTRDPLPSWPATRRSCARCSAHLVANALARGGGAAHPPRRGAARPRLGAQRLR